MAREMYLVGVNEEELKPTPKMEPPRTPRDKWANFWYHYKWLFLGVVFGVAALAYIIVSAATVNRPDYQVLMVTKYAQLDSEIEVLERQLAACGTDLDGDGEVEVRVLHCYMGEKGSPEYLSNNQALQAHVMAADVMLYAWEPACYEEFMTNMRNNTGDDFEFLCDLPFDNGLVDEGHAWNWVGSHGQKQTVAEIKKGIAAYTMQKQLPENLYFGVRTASELAAGSAGLRDEAMALLTAFVTEDKMAQ